MRLGLKTYRHISRKLRTPKKIYFFYSFKKLLLLFFEVQHFCGLLSIWRLWYEFCTLSALHVLLCCLKWSLSSVTAPSKKGLSLTIWHKTRHTVTFFNQKLPDAWRTTQQALFLACSSATPGLRIHGINSHFARDSLGTDEEFLLKVCFLGNICSTVSHAPSLVLQNKYTVLTVTASPESC